MTTSERFSAFLGSSLLVIPWLYFLVWAGMDLVTSVTHNHHSFMGLLVASEVESDVPSGGSDRTWYVNEIFWDAATNTNCTLRREPTFDLQSEARELQKKIKLGTTRMVWIYDNTAPPYCYDAGMRRDILNRGVVSLVFFGVLALPVLCCLLSLLCYWLRLLRSYSVEIEPPANTNQSEERMSERTQPVESEIVNEGNNNSCEPINPRVTAKPEVKHEYIPIELHDDSSLV